MESTAEEASSPSGQPQQNDQTPPPEYMMLTPAMTSYGGGPLNAVDILQIHQTDFEQSALTLAIQPPDQLTEMGLMQEAYYPSLDAGQFSSRNGEDFNYGQFSPTAENRLDSPGSQKSDKSGKSEVQDPFSPHCKIPLPTPYGPYEYWLEPSFISGTFVPRRRNERERQRVRNVNEGFERLRNHLPLEGKDRDKRLSKVETLRYAIDYIHDLKDILHEADERDRKQQQREAGGHSMTTRSGAAFYQ